MAALEEMSTRLMKPAKDLADWNFPFSEVLEEYYTLLESQRDPNLNKAALVIQNSANTYARRVEYLFQDITSLIQTVVDQEATTESKKNAKNDGKEKRATIDIIDFEPIDFAQYVGKNNNIKIRPGAKSSVKLLGQRFPQLENSSRSSKSDRVDSPEDEKEQDNDQDIGRKYAFRCNQYITASGMLAEHLKPGDLSDASSLEQSVNVPTELTGSRVDGNASEDNRELTEYIDPVIGLNGERCAVSTPLPGTENYFMDASFGSAIDSGRGSSLRTTIRPESSLSGARDGNWDPTPPRLASSLSIGDLNSLAEPENDSGLGNDKTPLLETSPCKRGVDESENLNDCSKPEATNISTKSDTQAIEQCRRSKRLRSLFGVAKINDSRPLEPISFDNLSDELIKSRTEFKLPCPVSLLKLNGRPHKRKINSEARKTRSLEKFLLNESKMVNKKLSMYSSTGQLFLPIMKEELKDLPKCLKKHLRNLRDLEALRNFEAVMDDSANLLGYKFHDRKSDASTCATTDTSDVTRATKMPDLVDDFPMPDTPESFNSPEPMSPSPVTCDSRIDRLVHEIYVSADVRTEQEEAVVKWHEDIQLRLREGRGRPKFEISEYTTRVMKRLGNSNGRITFDKMVRQDRQPEAARYLMATLMLANKYDLHIDTSDDEGNVVLSLLKE